MTLLRPAVRRFHTSRGVGRVGADPNRPEIRLGLDRMRVMCKAADLVQDDPSPTRPSHSWKAIHVAGTNGKGSTCLYLDRLLAARGHRRGLFVSPFLVQPEDSIRIDNQPISSEAYHDYTQYFARLAQRLGEDVSPFEMKTLVAFQAFTQAKVDYGVVEVGIGGRLDSTNVLGNKVATAITKIGMDHKEFLGTTLTSVAGEKAGIITQQGVPCVVDASNQETVLSVIRSQARKLHAPLTTTDSVDEIATELGSSVTKSLLAEYQLPAHQIQNAWVALLTYLHATGEKELPPREQLVSLLVQTRMPGRLSYVDIRSIVASRTAPILVDGAHNRIGIDALKSYVDTHLPPGLGTQSTTPESHRGSAARVWILSISDPRDQEAADFLSLLLRPQDTVIFTEYTPESPSDVTSPHALPRPKPLAASLLRQRCPPDVGQTHVSPSLEESLQLAAQLAGPTGPIVVTGSLYLVSDLYRLLQSNNVDIWA